jgi:hypothetical protein
VDLLGEVSVGEGRLKRSGLKRGNMGSELCMYKNRTMKSVQIALKSWGVMWENDERSESKIHCQHVCKFHIESHLCN